MCSASGVVRHVFSVDKEECDLPQRTQEDESHHHEEWMHFFHVKSVAQEQSDGLFDEEGDRQVIFGKQYEKENNVAKDHNERQFNLRKDWRLRRPEQGYSYKEVVCEIDRRARGEYVLTPEQKEQVYASAMRQLEIRFKLAALLSDFIASEGLTPESLTEIIEGGDVIHFALNPFSCGGERTPNIANDTLIDLVYPGKMFMIDRDEIKRNMAKA